MSDSNNTMSDRSLAHRLSRVVARVTRIGKAGHNDFHNYKYVAADDVVDTIRPLLCEEGVLLHYDGIIDYSREEHSRSQKGAVKWRTTIRVRYVLINVDNPEDRLVCEHMGEAIDSEDKGFTKASTSAMKYALLRMFMQSTGDPNDIEHYSHPTVDEAPAAPVQIGRNAGNPPGGDTGETEQPVRVGGGGDAHAAGGSGLGGQTKVVRCCDIKLTDDHYQTLRAPEAKRLLVACMNAIDLRGKDMLHKPSPEQLAMALLRNKADFPVLPDDPPGARVKRMVESMDLVNVEYGDVVPF